MGFNRVRVRAKVSRVRVSKVKDRMVRVRVSVRKL